jgi:predicted transglutaminase-like cysteine proteinase
VTQKKKLAAAVEMGRRGGKARVPKGFSKLTDTERIEMARKAVAARAAKLTPEQRGEIARKAAEGRWGKTKPADVEKKAVAKKSGK